MMESIVHWLNHFHIPTIVHAIALILIGYFLAKMTSIYIAKAVKKRFTPHTVVLLRRATFYLLWALFIVSAVQQLGFHVATILGAAGILTAAIGFASQTSMSNVISGLFIIGEKPFSIGDTIKVNDTQGEVTDINLLSVKIRTLDNTMIRIPNETLIKSAVINFSYYPIRRADLMLGFPYTENLSHIKEILFEVAEKNPNTLSEPKPSLQILNFHESTIYIQFSAWSNRVDFNEMKNSIQEDIQRAFVENGIKLSQSSSSVYFEHTSQPLPIQIIQKERQQNAVSAYSD